MFNPWAQVTARYTEKRVRFQCWYICWPRTSKRKALASLDWRGFLLRGSCAVCFIPHLSRFMECYGIDSGGFKGAFSRATSLLAFGVSSVTSQFSFLHSILTHLGAREQFEEDIQTWVCFGWTLLKALVSCSSADNRDEDPGLVKVWAPCSRIKVLQRDWQNEGGPPTFPIQMQPKASSEVKAIEAHPDNSYPGGSLFSLTEKL